MIWWLAACGGTPTGTGITLVPVAEGVKKTTAMAFQDERLVVTTQDGKVLWFDDGQRREWAEVDVIDGSERGLLGIAFHPNYRENGKVVLSWTAHLPDGVFSHIGIWTTKPGSKPGDAPLEPGPVLFSVKQPWSNHNGGHVTFGPDGMLYIGFGDGGKANDPLGSGQDGSTPLGAMLRLDVDAPAPHVPPDNPFVEDPKVHDAIWAIGLRNPWRFSFAPDGRLVAGDVGQNTYEELTFVPRGANLGWNHREGTACFQRRKCAGDFTDPFWTYGRSDGGSVTGGVVATSGPHAGRYFFADFASGHLWSTPLPKADEALENVTDHGAWSRHWSTFALDEHGAPHVADFVGGVIYAIR